MEGHMKRTSLPLIAVLMLTGVIVVKARSPRGVDLQGAPIYVTEIPAGYRDWKLISVAHEAGELNDIRAVLGNDIAIKAYREGKLPFPDGAIIVRIAWDYVPSAENNQTFG